MEKESGDGSWCKKVTVDWVDLQLVCAFFTQGCVLSC